MSINNPNKLVEEFKKSGEFDRIRREVLAEFQDSKDLASFKSRIEDVARQRLTNDHNLLYMPQEFIHRELMQELDRFPIVERSTSELPMLNNPTLSERIGSCLEKLLQDHGVIIKEKQLDHETLQDTQLTNSALFSSEVDKDPHSAVFEEETKQAQTSGTNQEVSETYVASSSKQEQSAKDKDSDSMDIDED